MDDLLQEFIAETRETLEAISGEIVAWEANPTDRARLDAIFRFVHTVKGSCGFLDLPRLARLSHAAEDVLAAVRDGKRVADAALVDAVLAIVDRIGEIVEAIDAGAPLDNSAEDMLIAGLAADAEPLAQMATAAPRSNSRSVRLGVELLDRMMSGMSEMVLARNELARRLREQDSDPRIDAALERLSLTVAEMRDTVTRTRMQKIDALFAALPRMVRDTAAGLQKSVALKIDGADVELDREMIELMRDPLVHLIRNAIDHGIETPTERIAGGKPGNGTLSVSARQSGNQILIEIADDGRGIDTALLVAKARRLGLYGDAELAAMDAVSRCDLVFHPGLSSRDAVTATSGRGVGMDVVRANVEQIGGRVVLANRPGQGLVITVHVPLTLSIISTIVVGCGGQRFALARQAVEEIVALRGDQVRITQVGGVDMATVRGRLLPLVNLGALLQLSDATVETLAIVSTRDGDYALGIDCVLDTEELVVKPAAPAVMLAGIYAGQTLPDSGQPMLLLDGSGIAAVAGLAFSPHAASEVIADTVAETGVRALMFDDFDGRRRAIALGVIDRVEPVPVTAIRLSAGRMRLAVGGHIVPLYAAAPFGDREEVPVMRLTDGTSEIAYAIAAAIDIVTLPENVAPARGSGSLAGVVVIGGEQVELVDAHALFADEDVPPAQQPVCLLHGDPAGWMETFLKPTLEAAGYRCVTRVAVGERAAVALAMEDEDSTGLGDRDTGETPVIRLRRDRAAEGSAVSSIYRYDRTALVAALAACLGER